jgi:hypothetical protein
MRVADSRSRGEHHHHDDEDYDGDCHGRKEGHHKHHKYNKHGC